MNTIQSLISNNQTARPMQSSYSTLAFLAAQSVSIPNATRAIKVAPQMVAQRQMNSTQSWQPPQLSSRYAAQLQAVPQVRTANPLI